MQELAKKRCCYSVRLVGVMCFIEISADWPDALGLAGGASFLTAFLLLGALDLALELLLKPMIFWPLF